MPRIIGVDIPNDKPTYISLMYLYGIGRTLALKICEACSVDPNVRAKSRECASPKNPFQSAGAVQPIERLKKG